MALITCPECATSVSSRAGACPKCACPFQDDTAVVTIQATAKAHKRRVIRGMLFVAGGFVGLFVAAIIHPAVTIVPISAMIYGIATILSANIRAWWENG